MPKLPPKSSAESIGAVPCAKPGNFCLQQGREEMVFIALPQ